MKSAENFKKKKWFPIENTVFFKRLVSMGRTKLKRKSVIGLMLGLSLCMTACGNAVTSTGDGNSLPLQSETVSRGEDSISQEEGKTDNVLSGLDEITEIPKEYMEESEKTGKIERIDYQTLSYDDPNETQNKYAYVYVPYGYDETKQYEVLYLIHGGGGSAETSFGGVGQSSELKRMIDNLIARGEMEPLLVVTPTFYPEGNADTGVSRSGDLVKKFPQELVNDLLPAVESNYATYADTVDANGLEKSRDHRAIGGFSMGSVTTWYAFQEALPYFRTFIPISGDSWVMGTQAGGTMAKETAEALAKSVQDSGYGAEDYYIYAITGSEDIAYPMMKNQIEAMRKKTEIFCFEQGDGKPNIHFSVKEGGVHNYAYVRQYLYHVMPILWEKDAKQ